MDIKKSLLEDSIMVNVETSSKKNVLELISQKLSKITTSNEDEIFEKLYDFSENPIKGANVRDILCFLKTSRKYKMDSFFLKNQKVIS